ncbi:MAG: integration host factor subunit beta [Bacteroidales bacterium]|nr:integration host factor subunit beta [Bacteroidales bacterium]
MKEKITQDELISAITEETGFRRAAVEQVVNSLLNNITAGMKNGKRVELFGFGTFQTVHHASRIARNPYSNESVQVPERFYPSFKPGKALKKMTIKECKQ